jgi:hypothetical protein
MTDVAFAQQDARIDVVATRRDAGGVKTAATTRKRMRASDLTAFDTHFQGFYDRTDRRSMD